MLLDVILYLCIQIHNKLSLTVHSNLSLYLIVLYAPCTYAMAQPAYQKSSVTYL